MNKDDLLDLLQKEVEKTTGCTDPVAVALAVAQASSLLGQEPDRVDVVAGQAVYKSVAIGIPGTNDRGLVLSAALGVYLWKYADMGLDILDYVNDQILDKAKVMMKNHQVNLEGDICAPSPIYVKAIAYRGQRSAWATIHGNYAFFSEKGINGEIIYSADPEKDHKAIEKLIQCNLEDLIDEAKKLDLNDLKFLVDAAHVNKKSAMIGMESNQLKLGAAMSKIEKGLSIQNSAIQLAKYYTAAGAEARAIGLKVPIVAIAGSGNHGITNFLGVLAVAETLNADELKLARALAISSVATIYIKGFLQRASAVCGCTMTAAVAVSAATVYLLDGEYQDMNNAMNSVIGTIAGIVCDGAKESCAYKLSLAAAIAIEFAFLAREQGVFVPGQAGIVSDNVEVTIAKLGKLNNKGMVETNNCVFEIIHEIQN